MTKSLPDTQCFVRPGIVEFGWGHPAPSLLPVEALSRASQTALERDGWHALAYGASQGPGRLIEPLCERLDRVEDLTPSHERMLVTGGVSQALDLLCTLLTTPGDVMLVESPAYYLALQIFRDHQLTLVPVPGDDQGLRPEALVTVLLELRRQGREARLLYTIPTFGNPSGSLMPLERRKVVVDVARRFDLTIWEDDVYHELWYDVSPPPSLYSLARTDSVIRLGSFSKILAPGLRLGWMLASPEIVQRCVSSGLLDSGGGVNHFTAHVVAAFLQEGRLTPHVEALRTSYRRRRDVLLDALSEHLPEGCEWTRPGGGFFVWLGLPPGMDSTAFLPVAEEHGVAYVPGAKFYPDGKGERFCRLAFTMLKPEELEEGARRLGAALRSTGA